MARQKRSREEIEEEKEREGRGRGGSHGEEGDSLSQKIELISKQPALEQEKGLEQEVTFDRMQEERFQKEQGQRTCNETEKFRKNSPRRKKYSKSYECKISETE